MFKPVRVAMLTVACLLFGACSTAKSTEQTVSDALERFRAEVDVPGATVAVRRPGVPDLFASSGDEQVSATGRFAVASVTKTLVAAETHALIQEGTLSLDDTIAEWTPTVPNAERISVRQLLSHTSGLTDAIDTPAWRDAVLADSASRFSVTEAVALAAPAANGEQGTYHYSNVNYLVLADIAEEVTGRPLADELAQRFWQPLGMDDTTLDPDDARLDLVPGWFTLEDNGWGGAQGDRSTFDPNVPRDQNLATFEFLPAVQSAVAGAGGIVSTWNDLLTWGSALADGRALGDVTPSLFYGAFPITDGQTVTTGYGLGMLAHACPCNVDRTPPNVRFSYHDGETIGSRTMFAVDRPSGTVIVIHANAREVTDSALLQLAIDIHEIVTE